MAKKILKILLVVMVCLTTVQPSLAKWGQVAKLTASDANAGGQFGISVSISGDYAIVGANPLFSGQPGPYFGAAYIYRTWIEQTKLTALDAGDGDFFGGSVGISGQYAIVGAEFDDDNGDNSGSAYIFKRSDEPNDPNWYQQAKLTASNAHALDCFGCSVSISGDYCIVGTEVGCYYAYIFERKGKRWIQKAKLTPWDGMGGIWFAEYVAIDGNYAIVGDWINSEHGSHSGAAYVYRRDGGEWIPEVKLTASDAKPDQLFGSHVAISGDYAIAGALGDNIYGTLSGSAYVFKRNDTGWIQQAKLTASDGVAYDRFGISVSISGDYCLVGADSDDDNGPDSGSAYIFRREGTSWIEHAKLTGLDSAPEDWFGSQNGTSISGNYAIVGAIGDDDYGERSGSAYIFSALCPPADITGNCDVDMYDFAVFSSAWLSSPGDDNWNPECDISEPNDNVIDLLDLKVFTEDWLK